MVGHLKTHLLTIKLKELGVKRRCDGFIVGIMLRDITISNQAHRNQGMKTYICLEIWMSQRLLDS